MKFGIFYELYRPRLTFPNGPSQGPRPRRTLETLPYPILSRLPTPRIAALRLAASRCGKQPQGTGDAASAAARSSRLRQIASLPSRVLSTRAVPATLRRQQSACA
jgi:hypothetical protein